MAFIPAQANATDSAQNLQPSGHIARLLDPDTTPPAPDAGSAPRSPISEAPSLTLEDLKPLGKTNVQQIIGRIINFILGLTGVVALIIFIWGGLKWMTAAGSPERVKSAQQTILWATLGLVVIFAAYSIVDLVIKALQ